MAVHKQFQELWFRHQAILLPPTDHRNASVLLQLQDNAPKTQGTEPSHSFSLWNLRCAPTAAIWSRSSDLTHRVDGSPPVRFPRPTARIVATRGHCGTEKRALIPPVSIGWSRGSRPDRPAKEHAEVESCMEDREFSESKDCVEESCCRDCHELSR